MSSSTDLNIRLPAHRQRLATSGGGRGGLQEDFNLPNRLHVRIPFPNCRLQQCLTQGPAAFLITPQSQCQGWLVFQTQGNRCVGDAHLPVRPCFSLSMTEDIKPLEVAAVGATEQAAAVKLLRRFSDQDLTLTDAAGLSVMN